MPYIALDPTLAAPAPAVILGAPLTSVGETLDSLQTKLKQSLGNRADATPALMAGWINEAYKHLASILKLRVLTGSFELPLTSSQPFYLLPAGVKSVTRMAVIDTDTYPEGGRALDKIDEHLWRRLADTIDEPTGYFTSQRMLVVWPTPLSARTAVVDCIVRVQPLVNPTDSPVLPEDLHEALRLRARHVAFRDLRMYTDAAAAQNDFISTLKPLRDSDADEREEEYTTMTPIRKSRRTFRER